MKAVIRQSNTVIHGCGLSAVCCGLAAFSIATATNADDRLSHGHSIEGDWVRVDTNGSGSFDGLTSSFAPAQLTPAAQAAAAEAAKAQRGLRPLTGAPHKAGDPYVVVDMPCTSGPFGDGALGVNPDSGAIHIVVSKNEVVIAPERDGVRVIYLDGRAQPPLSDLTARGSGHGVGHFEGGVLVADTIGLTTTGFIPAGGWRTGATHLAERFELSADGEHMTIHYTYTDPDVYVKPHSYSYQLDRLPKPSYALDEWCDAGDPKERNSVVPPPQQ